MFNYIYRFASLFGKFAEYDPAKIEQMSKLNPYPFKTWFGPNGREYVPFIKGQTEDESEAESYISQLLEEKGWAVTDYVGGYAEKNNRKMKIGKLLQELKKEEHKKYEEKLNELKSRNADEFEISQLEVKLNKMISFLTELERDFSSDPKRAKKGSTDLSIVFTQNPHDVATMSTGRGWTSCMNLEDGSHSSDVYCEISRGGFVAYLIHSNDTEIKKPIARIHIRRFDSKKGNSIAVPEESVYGTDVPGFLEAVKRWIDSKQGAIKPGHYKRKGGQWSDTFKSGDHFVSSTNISVPDSLEELKKILMGQIPDSAKYTDYKVRDLLFEDFGDDEPNMHNFAEIFDTKEEAEAYVREMNSYDWVQEEKLYSGPPWVDEDGEANYDKPRLKIIENNVDKSDQLISQSAERILKFPKEQLGEEVIQKLKELSINKQADHTFATIIGRLVFNKMPEIFSKEEISGNFTDTDIKHALESMPEEMAEEYKKNYVTSAEEILAHPELIIPEAHINIIKSTLSYSILTNFYKFISEPIIDFSKELSEITIRNLTNFVDNLKSALKAKQIEFDERIVNQLNDVICHILYMKDADTPSAQSFYQKQLDEFLAKKPSDKMSYDSLFRGIARLGENGKQFLPQLKELLKEMKEKYYENKNSQLRAGIINILRVIDSIESGTGRSSKYE